MMILYKQLKLIFFLVCIPDELTTLKKAGYKNKMPNFETLKIFYIWFVNRDRLTLPNLLSNNEFAEILSKPNMQLLTPADILDQKNYMRFLRVRGRVTYELSDGVLVIGSFLNGEDHELCRITPHLSSNSPKTLVNAINCDYCLMNYCKNFSEKDLLELGINRQLQQIVNLKKQALKQGSSGSFSVNKLMNSIYIELKKIDQSLAVDIATVPKIHLMEASRQISNKNNFTKGTKAALIKIGKTWGGLHLILKRFANEKTLCFEVSNTSITEVQIDNENPDNGGCDHDPYSGRNRDCPEINDRSHSDPLNSNLLALGDLSDLEEWPSIKSGNPSNEEKENYVSTRKNLKSNILRLKNEAEANLLAEKRDEEKITSLLMLEEANRALSEESINHERQKSKIKRYDLDSVKRAVELVGGTTLIDELAIPDAGSYPDLNNPPKPHFPVSKTLVKELFSKLSAYQKKKAAMQAELDKEVEYIDKLCAKITQTVDPELEGNSDDLKRAYVKMRSIVYEAGIVFEESEDYDSHLLELGDSDPTWKPLEATELTELQSSFDLELQNEKDSDRSGESEHSFIFPPFKKFKTQ